MTYNHVNFTHTQGGNRIKMAAALEFKIQVLVIDITSTKIYDGSGHNILIFDWRDSESVENYIWRRKIVWEFLFPSLHTINRHGW